MSSVTENELGVVVVCQTDVMGGNIDELYATASARFDMVFNGRPWKLVEANVNDPIIARAYSQDEDVLGWHGDFKAVSASVM